MRYNPARLQHFKALLRFYPKQYRDAYGEEMLYLASAMLDDANSGFERIRVVVRLVNDFARSAIRQNIIVYKDRLNQRPSYLRYSSFSAIALLVPYIFICAYNLIEKNALHRRTLLMQWEAHSWAVYCIFLPIAALMIIATAAAVRMYKVLKNDDDRTSDASFTQDALMLSVPITLLTTVALL